MAMGFRKKNGSDRPVDDSEVWKQKTLTSAANRKRFSKFMSAFMWIVAILVILACVYAYMIDSL